MHMTSRGKGGTRTGNRGRLTRPLARVSMLLALLLVSLMLATSVAASTPIVSTQTGEVPSTGALRPGPVGAVPPSAPVTTGTIPKAIQIAKADVNAQIEVRAIVNGVMQDPTGPWVVSWYEETARLGQVGNVVLAGHVDYWDVGPAVLYHVGNLQKGDVIDVTGADGQIYKYQVEWDQLFNAANAPLEEIVGPTKNQSLTIITCGGDFDYATGHYLQRRVIRAERMTS